MLLPAWTAVAADFRDWELVIAGPLHGEYADTIQGLARTLQSPRIKFVGQMLGDAKRELLAGASLFVLPTYSENFGMAVAEALAHGVPVITTTATPWTGISERNCGWCITPNESELREVLRKAMSLPLPTLHEMGHRGWEWMRRDYAWSSIAQKMQRTYEWLLHGGDRPDWVVVS
jgi:glycosyltransferase involved in cell wall biosynthesis